MSASQDAALVVENNLPDEAPPTYDDFSTDGEDQTEDPGGRSPGHGQDRHHQPHKAQVKPEDMRPAEREPVPAPKRAGFQLPDLAAGRLPLQRLTPATRTRDRDILRPSTRS